MIPGLAIIEKDLKDAISSELDRIGLLYRLFSRPKDKYSIDEKVIRKHGKYSVDGEMMQDVVGIRVVTYFPDDIQIVYSLLKTKLKFVSQSIDNHEPVVFAPKRTNLIFRLSLDHTNILQEIQEIMGDENYKLIDNTFEVQLRTILSEGWHEVDHSLRYKCKEDWKDYPEQERLLNGIYAALETNDSTLKSLFEDLSYRHFKSGNWEGMVRNKYRLRFKLKPLDESISECLTGNLDLAKAIFKSDRKQVLDFISDSEISIPITLSNIVYTVNHLTIKNQSIYDITPEIVKKEFDRIQT